MSSVVGKLETLTKLHSDLENRLNEVETDLEAMSDAIETVRDSFINEDTFSQFRDELEARFTFDGPEAAANFAVVAVRSLDSNGTFNINLPLDVVA